MWEQLALVDRSLSFDQQPQLLLGRKIKFITSTFRSAGGVPELICAQCDIWYVCHSQSAMNDFVLVLRFDNDFENDGLQVAHVNLTLTGHSGPALTAIHFI